MFEEIDYRNTPIGELALRRRRLSPEGKDIWEIKLNDGYLMSSKFIDGEIALADLALAMIDGTALDIVVGGLGLGYTAEAALRDPRVAALTVIELIPEVIEWHEKRLLPLGETVAGDARCHLQRVISSPSPALSQVLAKPAVWAMMPSLSISTIRRPTSSTARARPSTARRRSPR